MQQKRGRNRDDLDKFYTKSDRVNMCVEAISRNINIVKNQDVVIEPAAGNGAWIRAIGELCDVCDAYDIAPDTPEIQKQDFLLLDLSKYNNKRIHIIGNPPFGRQSSTAIKFIKKAGDHAMCQSISFILPKSFKKDSMRRYFNMFFHLIYEVDLPAHSFVINDNNEVDIPCVFQIWKRCETMRPIPHRVDPIGFKFVSKDDAPDVALRRVGVNAGRLYVDSIDDKNIQSHYFIKFNTKRHFQRVMKNIHKIKFEDDNTVGPKSISKQEVIVIFNAIK